MTDNQNQLSNRDILLEMRADIKSVMLGHAVLGERVDAIKEDLGEVKKTAADLREWRAKVMGMVIVAGGALGFLGSLARDALANTFHWR